MTKRFGSVVFVHDGPVFRDELGKYYEFAYQGALDRYSVFAGSVSFLIRSVPLGQNEGFRGLPAEISVIEVPDFKSPTKFLINRRRAERIIRACVAKNDFFILRLPSSIGVIAQKYIEAAKKPYLVEVVGCAWDSYFNHSALGKLVAPAEYMSMKRAVHRARYVHYVTREFLQRRYPSKAGAITVGCSDVKIEQTETDVLSKRLSKIRSGDGRTVALGTAAAIDVRYKGQQYVIEAMSKLKGSGLRIDYYLAGGYNRNQNDSYLRDLSESLSVSDQVHFLGPLSADKLTEFYDQIDVYIQPSKQEGLPRAVIEAMARACPVLGSNLAGIPELIDEDCLFRPGSVKEIMTALRSLPNRDLAKMARENFQRSKEYERAALLSKLESFYKKVLEDSGEAR
ncbi:glycosyltransferase family 4 protein [Thermophilibacter sp.]